MINQLIFHSRFHQRSVLGSVLVGLFLNGLENRASREVTTVANATKLFRVLKTGSYSKELRKDHKRLNDWAIVR